MYHNKPNAWILGYIHVNTVFNFYRPEFIKRILGKDSNVEAAQPIQKLVDQISKGGG